MGSEHGEFPIPAQDTFRPIAPSPWGTRWGTRSGPPAGKNRVPHGPKALPMGSNRSRVAPGGHLPMTWPSETPERVRGHRWRPVGGLLGPVRPAPGWLTVPSLSPQRAGTTPARASEFGGGFGPPPAPRSCWSSQSPQLRAHAAPPVFRAGPRPKSEKNPAQAPDFSSIGSGELRHGPRMRLGAVTHSVPGGGPGPWRAEAPKSKAEAFTPWHLRSSRSPAGRRPTPGQGPSF